MLERLEVCIISLNAIKLNLEGVSDSDINRETLRNYLDQVEEILAICQSLSIRWEQKLDEINVCPTKIHNSQV